MTPKALYVVSFILAFPAFITLLFFYSIHVINNDNVLKDMLSAAAHSTDKDRVFILKKSFAAQCFLCIIPLFSLMVLSDILFQITTYKKTILVTILALTLIASVYSFIDYFLSRIVIVNGLMYIRCRKTLYRPVVITLTNKCKYEEFNAGAFGLFASRYVVSISTPLGSCAVMIADNKTQLIETLNRINADQEPPS